MKAYVRGLQQELEDQGLWAIFLDRELGGPGSGSSAGSANKVIGRYAGGTLNVRRRRRRYREHGDPRGLRHQEQKKR